MMWVSARATLLGLIDLLPPQLTMPLYYRWRSGRWPEVPPRSFADKTQAAKLKPVTPEMVTLADKAAVKDVVRERLGPEWVIPSLYVGTGMPPLNQRNWTLPYVIKATHGSKWNLFVQEPPDWTRIDREVQAWLRMKPYRFRGEMHYRSIPPRLLVEPMIAGKAIPVDYKIFVFDGHARFVQVDTGRYTEHRRTFYDRDWQRLPFTRGYPAEVQALERPPSLARMLDAAERMASGFDFLRVDFYDVDGHPYFGEATFFPDSGIFSFDPPEYDTTFGEAWPWSDNDARS